MALRDAIGVLAVLLVSAFVFGMLALAVVRELDAKKRATTREGFLGKILGAVVKQVVKAVAPPPPDAKAVAAAAGGVTASAAPPPPPPYVPAYRGRQHDGWDWSCPEGTVETGAAEDGKACITSEFHPPVWKAGPDGKTWDHMCPNGTVPAPEGEWTRKCAVGWTTRVQSGSAWVCPGETADTGKTWTDPSWHEGHKQCKRSKPYTQRVQTADGKGGWVCPPGTKDTGKSWDDPVHGAKQCKWTGP